MLFPKRTSMIGLSDAPSPPLTGVVEDTMNSSAAGSNPLGGVPAMVNVKDFASIGSAISLVTREVNVTVTFSPG